MFKLKLIAGLIVFAVALGLLAYLASLPEKYREQGRTEEREKARQVSQAEITKRDIEFKDIQSKLENERLKNELFKTEHDKKFNKYVADVRAGRVPGLYINRNSVCAARSEETKSTGRVEESETARLPRETEEGLFKFGHDRDQVIKDFEDFKQEVRIAKCFAE